MSDPAALIFGLVFMLVGVSIIVKTWDVTLEELIRARIWGAGWRARLKWIGLALAAVGVVTILAGLGVV